MVKFESVGRLKLDPQTPSNKCWPNSYCNGVLMEELPSGEEVTLFEV